MSLLLFLSLLLLLPGVSPLTEFSGFSAFRIRCRCFCFCSCFCLCSCSCSCLIGTKSQYFRGRPGTRAPASTPSDFLTHCARCPPRKLGGHFVPSALPGGYYPSGPRVIRKRFPKTKEKENYIVSEIENDQRGSRDEYDHPQTECPA